MNSMKRRKLIRKVKLIIDFGERTLRKTLKHRGLFLITESLTSSLYKCYENCSILIFKTLFIKSFKVCLIIFLLMEYTMSGFLD